VLSLPGLRRLRFPSEGGGSSTQDVGRDSAARTALAALGVAAIALQWRSGFDLRSRCLLVPTADLRFDILAPGGMQSYVLPKNDPAPLLKRAVEGAVAKGFPAWPAEPTRLYPNAELVKVVVASRAVAAPPQE